MDSFPSLSSFAYSVASLQGSYIFLTTLNEAQSKFSIWHAGTTYSTACNTYMHKISEMYINKMKNYVCLYDALCLKIIISKVR